MALGAINTLWQFSHRPTPTNEKEINQKEANQ